MQQLFFCNQGTDRVGARIIPVAVKAGRQLAHDRACSHDVQINEVVAVQRIKVGITQIASARNANAVVCNKQLVVHALLGTLKVGECGQRADDGGATRPRQRVEHAHLNAGHKGHAHDLCVLACAVKVIQQYAHPYPALGRLHNGVQQACRAGVGMDGVVLQVQRLRGRFHQGQAAGKCSIGPAQQHKAGAVGRVCCCALCLHHLAQRCALRLGQRMAGRARRHGGQTATGGQQQRQHAQQGAHGSTQSSRVGGGCCGWHGRGRQQMGWAKSS